MNSTERDLAVQLGKTLSEHRFSIATAESCTGGLIAAIITDIPACSGWFERGFVTYSNAAKQDMLDVRQATLEKHGAVSEAVAREMAAGALKRSRADVTVAVTGIAGPDGGSREKPVGTVWFGWAWPNGEVTAECRHFPGDRDEVRRATVEHAFRTLIRRMENDFREQGNRD
ncbi:MAG TPA: nicotinamide-nucleotide amidase [Gammaproteobacteria bacterium]